MDIHLKIAEPCVTAIWGPSGCGKTTLLRALAGLDRVQEGSITVNGTVWVATADAITLAPHKRRVGFVFQDAGLFPHLSVKENLLYGYKRSQCRQPRFTLAKVVDLLDLHALLSRNPATLSGGQKQRVAIGRSLLSQPELLLLDEPVSALDSTSRVQILQLLRRIKSTCALPMLYITHQVDEVARLADCVCIMENGRIIDEGAKVVMLHKIYGKAATADHRRCSPHPFHNGNDCPYDLLYEEAAED